MVKLAKPDENNKNDILHNSAPAIAVLLEGNLSQGLSAKLIGDLSQIYVGSFVTIPWQSGKLFGVIFDLEIKSVDPSATLQIAGLSSGLFSTLFARHNFLTLLKIAPLLTLQKTKIGGVKTIPAHHSLVQLADNQDFRAIFGQEDFTQKFCIGYPVGSTAQVCIDINQFIERSNGIFGKTGTGKTFLTRLILAGLIKSGKAVNLIFDMHGEYGLQARSENSGQTFVKGLKTLFGHQVAIFSLDPESTIKKGCNPDEYVNFSWQDITIDDIALLQDELNLHSTAVEAANLLYMQHGKRWLEVLLDSGSSLKELAMATGAHAESLSALYRKMKRFENFKFIGKKFDSGSTINTLIEYLQRGISVVFEFGRQSSTLCYLLVSSIITRKIHDYYTKATEKFLAQQTEGTQPKQLVITIEEAHKFLNPATAKQTIFGLIAREMRKYFVSLLVIDQRPSGICDEIISQLGTKIVAKLEDPKDIAAILSGNGQSDWLKMMLATLETKGQAICFGHAIPVAMLFDTRRYDDKFYQEVMTAPESTDNLIDSLY